MLDTMSDFVLGVLKTLLTSFTDVLRNQFVGNKFRDPWPDSCNLRDIFDVVLQMRNPRMRGSHLQAVKRITKSQISNHVERRAIVPDN